MQNNMKRKKEVKGDEEEKKDESEQIWDLKLMSEKILNQIARKESTLKTW